MSPPEEEKRVVKPAPAWWPDPHAETQLISLWLLPIREHGDVLQAVIDRLAAENEAPRFRAHVTAFAGRCTRDDALPEILSDLAASIAPFQFQISGLHHSDYIMESVVIALAMHDSLKALYTGLGRRLQEKQNMPCNPHLSLIYREMPAARRSALVNELVFDLKHIRIDRICLAAPVGNDWHRFESWHCFHECALGA